MENTGIVITGASGFVGRHLAIAFSRWKGSRLFCLARRSRKEAGVPDYGNIHWLQGDIASRADLQKLLPHIRAEGGADYFFHLACYYDFNVKEHPAYEATNVEGTRNVLDFAAELHVKRFVFASSLAACRFPPAGGRVDECSPADADYPYARSKRRGEEIVREYSARLPCTVVRLAAVYSDWCEHPPLYMFLKNWLAGGGPLTTALGGKGESAVPYIHVRDLIKCFRKIMGSSDSLPDFAVYNASPDGCVTHNELFTHATRYFHGRDMEPLHVPKVLAFLGLHTRSLLGKITGREPFEQPWMAAYIDKKLNVDTTATREALGWETAPRNHILRRLLFLTDKMKNQSGNWTFRNEILLKRVASHRSFTIYRTLENIREATTARITESIVDPAKGRRFASYREMDRELLRWYVSLLYQVIVTTVRSRNKALLHNYAEVIAARHLADAFPSGEVKDFLVTAGEVISSSLLAAPEIAAIEDRVYSGVTLNILLLADEVLDWYEILESQPPAALPEVDCLERLSKSDNLKRIVRQLDEIRGDSLENSLSREIRNLDSC